MIFLRKNIKYVFVFLLLALVYFFGGDYQPAENKIPLKEFELVANKIYRLAPGKDFVKINNQLSTDKGDYYRLSFEVKSLPDLGKPQPNADLLSEKLEQSEISVYLQEVFGGEKQIGQIMVAPDNQTVPKEILFIVQENFRDIIFRRKDVSDKNQVDFSNVQISPLNCQDNHCLERLMPTIDGKNQEITRTFVSGKALLNNSLKFNRRNQLIGRVVDANFDHVQSVDLAMSKIGTGGAGYYQIKLFKIRQNKDNLVIEDQPIATTHFSPDDLCDYQIGENLYRFPLAAKLFQTGKYFIGVSNVEVEFNYLNNLRILESEGQYPKDRKVVSQSMKLTDGNIYLAINTVKYFPGYENNFLINAKIEDLGNGQGVYSYHFSHSPADFLDANAIEIKEETGSIYYDNVAGGVSMSTQGSNEVTYKFDTIYPFEQFFLEVTQLVGDFTSGLLYYSFDNSHWKAIFPEESADDKFEEQIIGNGQSHLIYLKMIPNSNDKNRPVKLFNIHDIDISANLKLR